MKINATTPISLSEIPLKALSFEYQLQIEKILTFGRSETGKKLRQQ